MQVDGDRLAIQWRRPGGQALPGVGRGTAGGRAVLLLLPRPTQLVAQRFFFTISCG